ncbi:hypothetical protein [Mycobacterium phage WXIN]|nr:hypothetical protein [Mycobacterium phage WXIN]
MTDVLVDPVVELENSFAQELPCGGNLFPETRACPENAPAALVSTHAYCDGADPQDFKCFECYSRWLRGHLDFGASFIRCTCGDRISIHEMYRVL